MSAMETVVVRIVVPADEKSLDLPGVVEHSGTGRSTKKRAVLSWVSQTAQAAPFRSAFMPGDVERTIHGGLRTQRVDAARLLTADTRRTSPGGARL
jgi:hypothetical protein